jgi:signal transduction histidine kinase
MERRKQVFEFMPMDIAPAVRAAVEAVRERFAAPGAHLEVDLPADLPRVRADREAVTTVLVNLLDNAWKYSGEQKIVKVRAYAQGGSVCLEVSDNGIGIPRRAQRRIFERFYQVDRRLSRRGGGCGLGLSIVKFIALAHGGTVAVRSDPGRGSTLTVRLPALAQELVHAP